jgi:hypothetical protein
MESYLDILLCVYWRKGELLGHSPMRIFKEGRVTWTFSHTYFEGKESYLDILLYVFLRNGVTWTFSYTYFEGKESYLDILLYVFWRNGLSVPSKYAYENVQVIVLSFKIRIGECPSRRVTLTFSYTYFEEKDSYLDIPRKSPFLQKTYRRISE